MPHVYRLISIILALTIAVGNTLIASSPALANGPTPPGLLRRQVEAQLQHVSAGLIFKNGMVSVDRTRLAGLGKNLRQTIERFANDTNAGKIGFATLVKGKVQIYGNRTEILRQIQQTKSLSRQTTTSFPVGVYWDGVYVYVDSYWTGLLKSWNWDAIRTVATFLTAIACTNGVVCMLISWFIGLVDRIVTEWLRPYNVVRFTAYFPWIGYIWLKIWRGSNPLIFTWYRTRYWII